VAKFGASYPAKIADAKRRLKELFDASQYPATKVVVDAFTMKYTFIEWGTPKRIASVNMAAYDREKAKAEASWANAAEQIEQALTVGMQQVVSHLVSRLADDAAPGGKKKRLHNSALAKVEEFLDQFSKRNLTGNAALADLVETARKVVSGVDVKKLKSDGAVRANVVSTMTSVKDALDKMMVDAPKRLMSLADANELSKPHASGVIVPPRQKERDGRETASHGAGQPTPGAVAIDPGRVPEARHEAAGADVGRRVRAASGARRDREGARRAAGGEVMAKAKAKEKRHIIFLEGGGDADIFVVDAETFAWIDSSVSGARRARTRTTTGTTNSSRRACGIGSRARCS